MRIFLLLQLIFFSLSLQAGVVDDFFKNYLSLYASASEHCAQIEKKRATPSADYLRAFPDLTNKELFGFLIYKNEIASSKCIQNATGVDWIFVVHALGDIDESANFDNNERITFLKIISNEKVLEARKFYLSIAEDDRIKADQFDYFDEPFNFVKMGEIMRK